MRWLLADFGVPVMGPTTFLFDSTSAISIARDLVKHELTKHIGVDASYTRSQVQERVLTLQFVPLELQIADSSRSHRLGYNTCIFSPNSVCDPP